MIATVASSRPFVSSVPALVTMDTETTKRGRAAYSSAAGPFFPSCMLKASGSSGPFIPQSSTESVNLFPMASSSSKKPGAFSSGFALVSSVDIFPHQIWLYLLYLNLLHLLNLLDT